MKATITIVFPDKMANASKTENIKNMRVSASDLTYFTGALELFK